MNLSLRTLILAFISLTLVFVISISGYFLYENQQRLEALKTGIQYLSLTKTLSALTKSLAEERGLHSAINALNLPDEEMRALKKAYQRATRQTDSLINLLNSYGKRTIPAKLHTQWQVAKLMFKMVPLLREEYNAFEKYTQIIRYLIALNQQILPLFPTKTSLHYLQNTSQLLVLREEAGEERGQIMKALIQNTLSPDKYFAIAGHSQQQQLLLRFFTLTAPQEQVVWLQNNYDRLFKKVDQIRAQLKHRFHNSIYEAKFLRAVGFAGFIHYYKNYQLSGNPKDYENAYRYGKAALRLLNQWIQQPALTAQQVNALTTLQKIFNAYLARLKTAKTLHENKRAPSEIAKMLDQDETPAVEALRTLEQLQLSTTPIQWWHLATQRINVFSELINQLFARTEHHLSTLIERRSTQQQHIALSIGVFMLLLLMLMALLLRHMQQLKDFTDQLHTMSKHHHFTPLPQHQGNSEMAQLTEAFNTLIQERKNHEQRIWEEANLDHLTQLPNRAYLYELLNTHLQHLQANQEKKLAILFIDLDGFKQVNDTEGHKAGDELLITLAKRMQLVLRQEDIIARIGGDEFVIILPQIKTLQQIEMVAKRLLTELNKPVTLSNGHVVKVSGSIGITLYPDDANDLDTLLMHADIAMYHAKAMGKNQIAFFHRELKQQIQQDKALLSLLDSVENEDYAAIGLTLHYQPIIDVQSGQVHHFEALIRWQHPTEGMLPPMAFIPLLEESKHIVPVGCWIAEQALKQASTWQQTFGKSYPIAINISPAQAINHFQALTDKLNTLAQQGFNLALLHLEVTESLVLEKNEGLQTALKWFKDQGCELYLDDFGTGYSALSYLKHYAFDVLKIDRSFIIDMLQDEQDYALVAAILSLADALEMQVVAEGVEDAPTLEALRTLHCHYAQGYYFSRPLPADEIENWLKDYTRA